MTNSEEPALKVLVIDDDMKRALAQISKASGEELLQAMKAISRIGKEPAPNRETAADSSIYPNATNSAHGNSGRSVPTPKDDGATNADNAPTFQIIVIDDDTKRALTQISKASDDELLQAMRAISRIGKELVAKHGTATGQVAVPGVPAAGHENEVKQGLTKANTGKARGI